MKTVLYLKSGEVLPPFPLKAEAVVKALTDVEPTCLPECTVIQFESFVSCQLAIYSCYIKRRLALERVHS